VNYSASFQDGLYIIAKRGRPFLDMEAEIEMQVVNDVNMGRKLMT